MFKIGTKFPEVWQWREPLSQYWELQWAVFLDVSLLSPGSGVTGEPQSQVSLVIKHISNIDITTLTGLTASRARALLSPRTSSSCPMWTATTGWAISFIYWYLGGRNLPIAFADWPRYLGSFLQEEIIRNKNQQQTLLLSDHKTICSKEIPIISRKGKSSSLPREYCYTVALSDSI